MGQARAGKPARWWASKLKLAPAGTECRNTMISIKRFWIAAAVLGLAALVAQCQPGAVREAESLATQAQEHVGLGNVQSWAVRCITDAQAHRLPLAGKSHSRYGDPSDRELAPAALPPFLGQLATEGAPESVSLLSDASGQPESVMLDWGLKGFIIGAPGYKLVPHKMEWYLREIQPGMFVYFREH